MSELSEAGAGVLPAAELLELEALARSQGVTLLEAERMQRPPASADPPPERRPLPPPPPCGAGAAAACAGCRSPLPPQATACPGCGRSVAPAPDPRPAARESGSTEEGGGLRVLGTLMLIVGVIWLVAAYSMDTTVSTGFGRAHNYGLLNERQTQVTISSLVTLVGAMCLGFGAIRRSRP